MTAPSEKNPRPQSLRGESKQKPTPSRQPNLYDPLPLYLSPVGVTWLPESDGEPNPETPAAIASRMLQQVAQPSQRGCIR
jgi:hypothetical protein